MIGGGIVGVSVLYHVAEIGWTDVVLIDKNELTSGSTWHAAGGMHTFSGDADVSRLQKYTIDLYRELFGTMRRTVVSLAAPYDPQGARPRRRSAILLIALTLRKDSRRSCSLGIWGDTA